MHWTPFAAALVTGAALAALLVPAAPARAKGDATGTLAGGGRAKGDISADAGETDRISVEFAAGQAVDVTFSAGFTPALSLVAPSGADVDLGFRGTRKHKVRALAVAETGTHEFRVASADGSQGTYSLVVRPKWTKAIQVAGAGPQSIDVEVPAGSKLGASVLRATKSDAGPSITSVLDPAGTELLTSPVLAKRGRATLAARTIGEAGTCRITIEPPDGTSAWKGAVTRRAPAVAQTSLSLVNGLDVVAYSDGLNVIFSNRCGGCHAWAHSYAGVRGYASQSLSRIRSGNMPPGGRLPPEQVALIDSWIRTGRTR